MGINIPFGVVPKSARCQTCGKQFRAKNMGKNIGTVDADDLLIEHELTKHGMIGDKSGF